jgi:hypothetical protein
MLKTIKRFSFLVNPIDRNQALDSAAGALIAKPIRL